MNHSARLVVSRSNGFALGSLYSSDTSSRDNVFFQLRFFVWLRGSQFPWLPKRRSTKSHEISRKGTRSALVFMTDQVSAAADEVAVGGCDPSFEESTFLGGKPPHAGLMGPTKREERDLLIG
jgi:hypothetical protein